MCCAHLTRAGVPVCPPVPVSCDEVIYSSARLGALTRARGGGWRSRPLGYLLFIYSPLNTELLTLTDNTDNLYNIFTYKRQYIH